MVPTGAYRFGNSGRDILDGPGSVAINLAFSRNFAVRERGNLQFRWETFNILNHANFAPPVQNLSLFGANGSPVATAGLITSTLTTSRQIQLGLKLIW